MIFEYLAPSFLYTIAKDIFAKVRGRGRRLTPAETLALRQKWKPEFERVIWEKTKNKHGMDVIIRDVARLDQYPDTSDGKGISAWFKVGLMGTYERGILAGLRWGRLINDEAAGGWRCKNYKTDKEEGEAAILTGRIPYENIEAIDLRGDDYYSNAQIYCHFTGEKKQPYEDVGIYFEHVTDFGPTYYTEVSSYAGIIKRSQKHGVRYFG